MGESQIVPEDNIKISSNSTPSSGDPIKEWAYALLHNKNKTRTAFPPIVEGEGKVGVVDRVGLAIIKYLSSPTRGRELALAGTMYTAEQFYDVAKVAREGNEFANGYMGMHADTVGTIPSDPNVRAVFDSMGDIWEISVGQTIVRVGLHALYERLGKQLLSEDDTFALSLVIPLALKSAHTLGLISIFGIHDRVGNLAPEMFIGQIVASATLMYAHYSARRREIRADLALRETEGESDRRVFAATENLAINSGDEMSSI